MLLREGKLQPETPNDGGKPRKAQAAGLGAPASSPPPCHLWKAKSPEGAEPRAKAGAVQLGSGRTGKSFLPSDSNSLALGTAPFIRPLALHRVQQ